MSKSDNTYHAPGLRGPRIEDIRALNEELRFKCSEEELQEMLVIMDETTQAYQRISEMTDPSTPLVKYPRTPGYKPATPEDNPYNAWAWRCDIKGAATGKLAGKTVAIKDNTAVAGVPMTNGSKILEGYVPEFDATVVSWILDAGGRILGKSAVEDSCVGCGGILTSDGPVRNVHDQTRIAGGSSSGSAALVAAGLVDMATGGDQGGSIRIPASFTGIVGLKPTWGLVPYTGISSIEPTIDHVGPMAKTVADCALMLEVIAGYDDGRDCRQIPGIAVPEYSKLLDESVAGKKIGLLMEGFDRSEDAVQAVVRGAASRLTQAGCIVKDTSIPIHKNSLDIVTAVINQGVFKCMFENCGTGYSRKGFSPTSLLEATSRGMATHRQDIQPLVKQFALHMTYLDRLYGSKFFSKGRNLTLELTKKYDAALEEFDVLVMPTATHVATKIPPKDSSFLDIFRNGRSMYFNTKSFNITGHPALSINAGYAQHSDNMGTEALPVGMMIVGRKFDELTVLQIARAVEKLVK